MREINACSQGRRALQFIDPEVEEIKLCFLFFFFLRWTLLCCVAEGVFELLIFLPPLAGGCDYRCVIPRIANLCSAKD